MTATTGNTSPIFSRQGQINWGSVLTAANTATDGTGTVATAFTADATDGSYIQRLRIKPVGANVASVMRIFINNGSATTVAANNFLYGEVSLPATTASNTAAMVELDYPLNIALPPGFRITYCIATAVAGGWAAGGIGGSY